MGKDSLRPCIVQRRIHNEDVQMNGWFHCWEHCAQTVGESPLRGGHAAGQISFVLGIVELEDGRVVSAYPSEIQFTDRG